MAKITGDNKTYVKDYPRERYEQDLRMIDLVAERGINPYDFEDVPEKMRILGESYNGLRVASDSDAIAFLTLEECSSERICMALRKEYLTASKRINEYLAGKRRIVETAPKRERENKLVKMVLEELEVFRMGEAGRKKEEERKMAEAGEQLAFGF